MNHSLIVDTKYSKVSISFHQTKVDSVLYHSLSKLLYKYMEEFGFEVKNQMEKYSTHSATCNTMMVASIIANMFTINNLRVLFLYL